MIYSKYIKRGFDIVLSGLALLILFPLILLIALLVLVFMGRPIIFKQERTGKNDKIFYIYKFTTMKNTREKNNELLPDEERKCVFGNILRSTSLDELPELWNIFVGDVSIIGPRPLLVSYLSYYTENEKDRNKVRGGLIPPNSSLNLTQSWDEQLAEEAEYARNVTFLLDLKVFVNTFAILNKRVTQGYGEYIRQPLYVEREERKEKEIANL